MGIAGNVEGPATRNGGRIALHAPLAPGFDEILTPEALAFVGELQDRFGERIAELLAARERRAARLAAGERPDFLAGTADVRTGDWKVAPIPPALVKRVVEITGPVDRKMIINALNSGADAFMADFEDANAPTWTNNVSGQLNLRDAIRRTITLDDATTGKSYRLAERTATLLVRPRGLHLLERHMTVGDAPVRGSLFDFGLYFLHNAAELLARGAGPYFYLPKLESHLEARLWNDVFVFAQERLGVPRGSIRATVLIETLPAAFEMDEILHELREHSAGLNCGRWDYIFSFIKTLQHDPAAVMPDRGQVTMTQPNMRAYSQLVIRTCHRRGVHAMGGMSAFIPVKGDAARNDAAMAQVRADKIREATDGHDGTWVAHPALVAIAREAFEETLQGKPNQLDRLREDVTVTAEDILRIPTGTRTEQGLRTNIRVGVQYVEAWLRGSGAVPLYNLMEDAATAEISRTQIWQWIRHEAALEDGRMVTRELFATLLDEEMETIAKEIGRERMEQGRFDEAKGIFASLCTAPELRTFLTLPAYDVLTARN